MKTCAPTASRLTGAQRTLRCLSNPFYTPSRQISTQSLLQQQRSRPTKASSATHNAALHPGVDPRRALIREIVVTGKVPKPTRPMPGVLAAPKGPNVEAKKGPPPKDRKKKDKRNKIIQATSQTNAMEGEEAASGSPEIRNTGWEAGWGEDELRPPDRETTVESDVPAKRKQKRDSEEECGDLKELPKLPFELRPSPLMYTRRVEGVIDPDEMPSVLEEVSPPSPQLPVAKLEHNLERVLFNPGVHWLQDPRSRVYNFDPYLQYIPSVTDFAFERLDRFVASSADPDLDKLLEAHNKKFSGSTSSLSGMLCHIYFLLSADRLVDTTTLSRDMQMERRSFTPGQRMPSSVVFNYKDGKYAVDTSAEKSGDAEKNILTWLGTLLEKFVTMPKEKFIAYRRSVTNVPLPEKSTMREAFRFSKTKNFIMRSQLDCHDARLPGTGVFDIKTRACMPIRLDIFNFEENSGYLIRKQYGQYESFEREYYDLIRSAFLKYQFQVRIGNMDGVIVAYHNTKQMFGFQYVPLEEMDERLFGPGERVGDRLFKACVGLLENVSEEVVSCFPNESVRATFETLEGSGVMNIWVEPLEWDEEQKGERPIKQLEVRTWNYLNSQRARDWEAFRELEHGWSVRWQIAHMNTSAEWMREKLMGARQRQFRAWATPSGVDPEDLQEWYESLNFGGTESGSGTFNPDKFTAKEDRNLELLRRLAREGRQETERIRELEEGKPRHVLGQI